MVIAVRRALAKATSWSDHEWQVVPRRCAHPGEPGPGRGPRQGGGSRPPSAHAAVLGLGRPAVVIGWFQCVRNEVDAEGRGATGCRWSAASPAAGPCSWRRATASRCSPLSSQPWWTDGFAGVLPVPGRAGSCRGSRHLGVEAFCVPLNDIATPQGGVRGSGPETLRQRRDGPPRDHELRASTPTR
ncbi:hypothetical protein QJS66_03270 [Kocuria rhizophila]|nr:hypothetical protein QJS66_03270 [Kocuria rhizophila]